MPYRPLGISLGAAGRDRLGRPGRCRSAVPPATDHPAIGPDFDLDLRRVFGVPVGQQGLAAIGTHTLLGRQFEDFLADRQMGIIPSLGSGVPRLLAPFPLRSLGVVLGIIQVIGAIFRVVVSERLPKRSAWSWRFSPSSCSTFCSNSVIRFRASRWRLFQYPACWRNSRFSRFKRSTSARSSATSRLESPPGQSTPGRSRSDDRPVPVGRS